MNATILWASPTSANLGVRVLAEGAKIIAREVMGESSAVSSQDFGASPDMPPLGGRAILRDIATLGRELSRRIPSGSVVFDTGAGDSFTDIYGLKRLSVMAYVSKDLSRRGIARIMLPQTIGPFTTRLGERIGRSISGEAARIYPRDSRSERFARDLGIQCAPSATDMVFVLPEEKPEQHRDVIVNVSGLMWNGGTAVDSAAYRGLVTSLIQELLRSGRSVSLMSHVINGFGNDDDVPPMEELQRTFSGSIDVIAAEDLSTTRQILAGANLTIGSRMHFCLNSISNSTPSLPMAYSRKFAPLLADISWNHTLDLHDGMPTISAVMASLENLEAGGRAAVMHTKSIAQSRVRAMIDDLIDAVANREVMFA